MCCVLFDGGSFSVSRTKRVGVRDERSVPFSRAGRYGYILARSADVVWGRIKPVNHVWSLYVDIVYNSCNVEGSLALKGQCAVVLQIQVRVQVISERRRNLPPLCCSRPDTD